MNGNLIPSEKLEHPPLLVPGRHVMSLEQMRSICVEDFPLSNRRSFLWDNFVEVYTVIKANGLNGELWIDGSFLTQKTDPDDIDFTMRVNGHEYDNASEEQLSVYNWLQSDKPHIDFNLHTFLFFEYPNGPEDLKKAGITDREYWDEWWGTSRKGVKKGFAVIQLNPFLSSGRMFYFSCLRKHKSKSPWPIRPRGLGNE